MIKNISAFIEKEDHAIGVFLDLDKAFDTISVDLL